MESTLGLLFPEKIIGLHLKITYVKMDSSNIGGEIAKEEMILVQLVIAAVVRCGSGDGIGAFCKQYIRTDWRVEKFGIISTFIR
jgi:hypothetical protein